MKLRVFFGLIIVLLVSSLMVSHKDLRSHKKPVNIIIKVVLLNIVCFGSGSLWWFFTETDGISQGIGVLIYLGSTIGISLISAIFIIISNSLRKDD